MLTTEQLEARQKGLGGSDAPIVCGVSHRMTALDLYYQKRGQIPPADGLEQEAWVGSQLEPMLDAWYRKNLEKDTRQVHKTRSHRKWKWMLAHPDRIVVGEKRGLEFKVRAQSKDWGRDDTDATDMVPDDVMLQCQHYMEVMNYDLWDVVVFFPPFEFRHYVLERNRELIENLLELESNFWDRVERGSPPEADWEHESTYGLYQRMYPGTNGQHMNFPPVCQHWHEVYTNAREQRLAYEKLEKGARNHLLHEMGHHAIGYLPDGSAYHRKVKDNGSIQRFYWTKAPTRR